MKVIICFVVSFLAVYSAANDVTNEKLEKIFTNIFLENGKHRYENRTIQESNERVVNLKKDNVDVTLTIKERKLYVSKVMMDVTSEIKGNTFVVNATSIYSDGQEDGVVQASGTVDQKPLNEAGQITINWKRLRESGIVKSGEFNATHVTIMKIQPENEWSTPTVKISGLEELMKHVTNEDIVEAINSQMKKKQMQEQSFDDTFNLESDSIPRSLFEEKYRKLVSTS